MYKGEIDVDTPFAMRPAAVAGILILLHLAITIPLAYTLSLSIDEASTLHTTQNGLVVAIQNALADEKQAPLYFWILSLWRDISSSIFFARLFSIIICSITIKFSYDLARKLFSSRYAIGITAIFALHPFLIWTSLEIRAYSVVVLLSILFLNFYFDGFSSPDEAEDRKLQRRSRILLVVISIVGLYINYYFGFLLVSGLAGLIALGRWREAKSYFLYMIIVGLAFLPLTWALYLQMKVNTSGFQADRSLIEGVRILWGHALMFILPTEMSPPEGGGSPWSLVRLWIVRLGALLVIVAVIRSRGKVIDKNIICFAVFSAVIGVFLLVAYFALGTGYIEIRHATVLFVPLFLFVGSIVFRVAPVRVMPVVIFLYAISIAYGIYALYPENAKRGDWARVASYIEQNEKPDQPIIVFRPYEALALPYHYHGPNQIFPNNNLYDWPTYEASPSSEDAFSKQIAFVISQIPPDAEELWLVTEYACQKPGSRIACKPLEDFVESNFDTILDKDLYRVRVRLLKKQYGPSPALLSEGTRATTPGP